MVEFRFAFFFHTCSDADVGIGRVMGKVALVRRFSLCIFTSRHCVTYQVLAK